MTDPAATEPPAPSDARPKSGNGAIIAQSILIAVLSVIAGKLADRLFPQFQAAGVFGAIIGGVVSGGLAVRFERKSKRKDAIPADREDV